MTESSLISSIDGPGTLFDSHCHFDFEVFGNDESRLKIWDQCRQQGVQHLLIPGVAPAQWQHAYRIAGNLPGVLMALGVHPWWIKKVFAGLEKKILSAEQLEHLISLSKEKPCVAIGECGLDAAIDININQQLPMFEQHLQLASELDLPLIIHVRKTHNETLALLKRYRPKAGGVIHGFTGSLELAQRYWALGFYLGIGGSITYSHAAKTRNTVKNMPLESLLLETDAPDMPLQGYQGRPNSPLRLNEVAKAMADLRNVPIESICRATTENSLRLFKI